MYIPFSSEWLSLCLLWSRHRSSQVLPLCLPFNAPTSSSVNRYRWVALLSSFLIVYHHRHRRRRSARIPLHDSAPLAAASSSCSPIHLPSSPTCRIVTQDTFLWLPLSHPSLYLLGFPNLPTLRESLESYTHTGIWRWSNYSNTKRKFASILDPFFHYLNSIFVVQGMRHIGRFIYMLPQLQDKICLQDLCLTRSHYSQ